MLFALMWACSRDVNAPPEIRYDHEACDHCGMLISDPAFSAALTTPDGDVLGFDDPGCLFRYVMDHPAPYAHMWFHDGTTWLMESQVAFTTGAVTPMGSGLKAVVAGTPGGLSVGEASGRAIAP